MNGSVDRWARGQENASDHAPTWITLDLWTRVEVPASVFSDRSQQRKEPPFPDRQCVRVNSDSQFDAVYRQQIFTTSRIAVAPLLQHPAVAIGGGEVGEAGIVPACRIKPARETPVPSSNRRLVPDLTDGNPTFQAGGFVRLRYP